MHADVGPGQPRDRERVGRTPHGRRELRGPRLKLGVRRTRQLWLALRVRRAGADLLREVERLAPVGDEGAAAQRAAGEERRLKERAVSVSAPAPPRRVS